MTVPSPFAAPAQKWSGGAIQSTIHRVIYRNPGGPPRFSFAFFLHPSPGSLIPDGQGQPPIDTYEYVVAKYKKLYSWYDAAAQSSTPLPAPHPPPKR